MAVRRPAFVLPGVQNQLRGLPHTDAALVELLADRDGVTWLDAEYVASAVNRIRLIRSIAGVSPKVKPGGSDANQDLLLGGIGTGKVKAGLDGAELEVATVSAAQVLTFKDLRDPSNAAFSPLDAATRQWLKDPGSVFTIQNLGFPAAPTTYGTVSAGDDVPRPYASFATGAVIGDRAGIESATYAYARRSYSSRLRQSFRTSTSIANVRIWSGFLSASLAAIATPTTQRVACWCYDTSLDGTAFWRVATNDGTTTTRTATSIAMATGSHYRLYVEMRSADVRFWADGVLIRTETATLPGSTQNMGIVHTIETLDTVSKSIRWGDTALQQGY